MDTYTVRITTTDLTFEFSKYSSKYIIAEHNQEGKQKHYHFVGELCDKKLNTMKVNLSKKHKGMYSCKKCNDEGMYAYILKPLVGVSEYDKKGFTDLDIIEFKKKSLDNFEAKKIPHGQVKAVMTDISTEIIPIFLTKYDEKEIITNEGDHSGIIKKIQSFAIGQVRHKHLRIRGTQIKNLVMDIYVAWLEHVFTDNNFIDLCIQEHLFKVPSVQIIGKVRIEEN